MAAIASTSTPPQSMIRTDLDHHHHSESIHWTPLTPSSSNDSKRIVLPPIRTLLNEQLSYREPAPNSASSSTTSSSFRRKLNHQSTSPVFAENALPSPASSSHRHHNVRKPIIPSHSSSASPLMDLRDCVLQKHSSRRRLHHHHHHHPHPSSPYSYDHRRPSLSSLSQSSHSSSYLDSNIPSPTQMTDSTSPDLLLKSQRAASWVSQFSLQMSMNSASNKNASPLASPISSASSGYAFPGPLESSSSSRRMRQDTNETIREEIMAEERSTSPPPPPMAPPPSVDCTPMYSSVTPPPLPPSSAPLQKKQSCAFTSQKRLWELPLCVRK